ncbi:MAG: substrate-binding domain-containing protein [Actinobacteria bacterium]|nr:substrate-binding domain-containing protein [Actinomycetota bacterium]
MFGRSVTKYIVSVVSLVATFMFILPACAPKVATTSSEETVSETETAASSETVSEEKTDEPFEMVVIVKLEHPWFDDTEKGIKEAAEELGVNAYMIGPAEADAAQQIAMIEDSIAKGVDAISVVPNDPKAIAPALKKAQDAGIVTITHESVNQENVLYDVEGFDNAAYGAHIMDLLAGFMGKEGEYATFCGNLTAVTLNQWADAYIARQKEAYPDMKLVTDRIVSDENTQVAHDKTLELIKTYPNLKGILGTSSAEAPGIGLAVEEKGLQDKISVVGPSIPSLTRDLLKTGAIDAISVRRPKGMGYVQVQLMYYLLTGKEIVDGMDFPGLGKIYLDGKNIYPVTPEFTDITAENVDEFDF